MRSDPESVVEGLFFAWQLADVEATLSYCAESIVYVLHVPPEASRYHGPLIGKPAVRAYLQAVVAAWEFLSITPGPMQIENGVVREITCFRSRYRKTGAVIESCKRHVWHVEHGLVTRCEEFQDNPLMQAFFGLSD